ncbi:Myb-like DNA-binding domain containing protein [Trichomonas vaginalis G3]|uniref:Myb-like DNA-binding domain containing protein n=1 Tax=Trichomonas vaginalis (strain ATCC PRA-98 / G3) TaxID=412133 RepID=A2ELY4_TRIV3|nr:RNA polymerase II transcription regulator recruiting protein [Trichomonas vaginalis G3]EAY06323.1 Myb-like DNA-binding domain containing protein [Trichomonas vaginalis G3]KAI5489859.1 RNA polymerase II transcription regulator recruiting protein [Trichomonas vaginalis G3]|eukprot:XP_001318546.1 Myb-like DNA-binding domain containing protein [Trichomonas vaginalis G3]
MFKRVIHRFSKEEDEKIIKEVKKHDNNIKWAVDVLEKKLGANHSRRSIIERYKGFLSQSRDNWTAEEDKLILDNYKIYGNKWAAIAKFLKNRSGDQVKIRHKQLTKVKTPDSTTENSDSPIEVLASSQDSISEDFWTNFITDFEMNEEEINRMLCLI